MTTPERTILDGVRGHVPPDLVVQAISQAGERGLVAPDCLAELRRALAEGST